MIKSLTSPFSDARRISSFPHRSRSHQRVLQSCDRIRRTVFGKSLIAAVIFMVPMLSALHARADDGRIQLASISPERELQKKRAYVPPRVIEQSEFYEIRGSSEQDLREQMARYGYRMDDGKKYASVTRWNITWDYDARWTGDACSVGPFRVTVDITIGHPKWKYEENAPGHLVEKWEGFMGSLSVHERGHRDIAVDAAGDLSRAVLKLPADLNCAEFEHQLRSLALEVMNNVTAEQIAYDRSTDHGSTQSAVFR